MDFMTVCTVELDSIEVNGTSATYAFHGVGSNITGFTCKLDGVLLLDCMPLLSQHISIPFCEMKT